MIADAATCRAAPSVGCSFSGQVAVIFVYLSFAILSWFTFVYGMLVYQLLGSKAEKSFTTDWGIGLAIEACI